MPASSRLIRALRNFRESLRNPTGAMDLASILVGVLVVTLLTGAVAFTANVILPWANDQTAKSVLRAARTAESVQYTESLGNGRGTYVGQEGLFTAANASGESLMQRADNLLVNVSSDGSHYIAAILSGSGNIFYASDKSDFTGVAPTNAGDTVAPVFIDTAAPPQVGNIKATVNRLGNTVTWDRSKAPDAVSYAVYRTGDGKTRELIGANTGMTTTRTSYLDVSRKTDRIYTYYVTAFDKAGNQSRLSISNSERAPEVPVSTYRYDQCPANAKLVGSSATNIQNQINAALPGDAIRIRPGTWVGNIKITASGTPDKPIWICGGRDVILGRGSVTAGFGVQFDKVHDVILTGMTITDSTQAVALTGSQRVTVSDVLAQNIGQEAIKLRYNTTDSHVVGNTVRNTGLSIPEFGEGIYLGTSPAKWAEVNDGKIDRSDRNTVAYNDIAGTTADPIEAKQGTSDGTIIGNTIDAASLAANPDVKSSIFVKGSGYLVRDNVSLNTQGHAFRADIDFYTAATEWAAGNVFVKNSAFGVPDRRSTVFTRIGYNNVAACNNTVEGHPGATVSTERCYK